MNLVVDQTLIDFVVSHGTDPKFGARPMNRAIQEKVEQIIADKIIRGDITSGTPITLTPVDLNIG
jgi:ATP-dependent Clp protease ATP-binding subunit ClpB